MKVINLFGAPGAGKSTTMLGLTYHLKLMGLSVENTPEFFKEMLFEDSKTELFGGQLYVLGEQNRRLARLMDKNDLAVTDCPLPLIGYYTSPDYVKGFNDFVKNLYDTYNNVNYFIKRTHEFENEKRKHDEGQSRAIENQIPQYLDSLGIPYKVVESSEEIVHHLIDDLIADKVITVSQLKKARNAQTRNKYAHMR